MVMTKNGYLKAAGLAALLALAACGTVPQQGAPSATVPRPAGGVAKTPARNEPGVPALPAAGSGRGGYYQDDGPGDNPPPNLADVPDAEVRNDPLLPRSNRPYVVFGKTYTPITNDQPYTQRGVGSWYGKKFHGQRTSSGELYDMYKMTAAHPTLPIPSYARLTNVATGAQVIVRVNDRGPFHSNRAIDVSYTAALKLGLLGKGSHELQIERILPAEIDRMLAARAAGQSATTPLVLAPKPVTTATTATAAAAGSPEFESLVQGGGQGGATAAGASGADKGGFYLQLGAYARAENAETVRGRLARLMGNLGSLEVVQGGTVHRLFSGPFATRQAALQAAQALPAAQGLKPIVIQR
ncbi:septal ring lytic transglycosylase RlpA family protein [Rugamonas apoptosis]|uniref:Endolytic peptidoglycan transglycosylase RlpA n=1 Tax=Rugamonas apoptosis TaxID=2758570 RepID=A0A7W2FBB0_9BURK|nr:septal ring lytic transglycosylase RlpA family protein [Rugamonas apoptosis]MBA5688586.1 septal ring lytic transglycosylase RlpA family protein [Rugamonas apoptosis]